MTAESSDQAGACPHATAAVGERYNPFDPAFSLGRHYIIARSRKVDPSRLCCESERFTYEDQSFCSPL